MGKEGIVKSLKLFSAFIMIWAPYRYITGRLGWWLLRRGSTDKPG